MKKKVLDIFSTKKPKKKEKTKPIITDHRERNSLVPEQLEKEGFDLEFQQLKVADYLVKDIAIERKTVNDFITSMKNRRLLKQLEELQQYKKRLLIVEGRDEQELYTDSEDWIGMHPNSIRGFLLSIVLKYNVPIIFTKNYLDTVRYIALIAKKKTNSELSLNVKKKALNKKEQLRFIVESFPGIGPKNADKLMKHFRTLKNLINSSEEELKEVIGKKSEII